MDVFDVAVALEEIKLRYEVLGVVSAPKDDVMTSKPKPGSKAPISAHLTSMTDPRTVASKPGDVMSVPGTLRRWYWNISAKLSITIDGKPHSVQYYCDWISRFLEYMDQELLDSLGADMVGLVQQLKEVTGEPKSKPFGFCKCGEALYYCDADPLILCNACGTIYDTYRLIEQLATQKGGQTLVTRATLAAWTGRSEHTIRARCTVVDYDISGKALYDAKDAQHVLESISSRR